MDLVGTLLQSTQLQVPYHTSLSRNLRMLGSLLEMLSVSSPVSYSHFFTIHASIGSKGVAIYSFQTKEQYPPILAETVPVKVVDDIIADEIRQRNGLLVPTIYVLNPPPQVGSSCQNYEKAFSCSSFVLSCPIYGIGGCESAPRPATCSPYNSADPSRSLTSSVVTSSSVFNPPLLAHSGTVRLYLVHQVCACVRCHFRFMMLMIFS